MAHKRQADTELLRDLRPAELLASGERPDEAQSHRVGQGGEDFRFSHRVRVVGCHEGILSEPDSNFNS